MKTLLKNRWLALWLAVSLVGAPALRAQDDPAPDSNAVTQAEAADASTNAVADPTEAQAKLDKESSASIGHSSDGNRNAMVVFGRNAELKPGETAEAVVVIGGSAVIRGKVRDAAVVVGGNLQVGEGAEIGDAAVAVMGSIDVRPGAEVKGEAVAVGGKVNVEPGGKVGGQTQEVDFGLGALKFNWLEKWLTHCVFKLRPLAPQVGWVWAVWGVFFLLYLFIAAIFQRPVNACVEELHRRPATTFLLGLLTKLLLPVVFLLLAITGVGLLVIPFLFAGFVLAAMVGKVALLQALGQVISAKFGKGQPAAALVNFLIGVCLITVLYMVPVVGLLTFAITALWGLGAATAAAFVGFKRELPEKPSGSSAPPPSYTAPVPPTPPTFSPEYPLASAVPEGVAAASTPVNPPDAAFGSTTVPPVSSSPPPAMPVPPIKPPAVDLLAYPKASFWERMGAAFLDTVLVSILGGIVGGPPMFFLVALAYFAGMWAWQGTTIGGIVIGLKVVRYDGHAVSFTVALVRGLAAAFSIIVLFLGFLWIAWDAEKQGWHDKIAGTVVVRLPKGTPLVCI